MASESKPGLLGTEFPEKLLPNWEGQPVYRGMTGSHAFGVNTADSDYDYFCVWLHPLEHYLGMDTLPESDRKHREMIDHRQEPISMTDLVTIDIRYFFLQLYRGRLQFSKWLWVPSNLRFLDTVSQAERLCGDLLCSYRHGLTLHTVLGAALHYSGLDAIKTIRSEEPNWTQITRGVEELGLLTNMVNGAGLGLGPAERSLVRLAKQGGALTFDDLEGIIGPPCRLQKLRTRGSRRWHNELLNNIIKEVYSG